MLVQPSLAEASHWSAGVRGPKEYLVRVGPAHRPGNLLLGGGGEESRARGPS